MWVQVTLDADFIRLEACDTFQCWIFHLNRALTIILHFGIDRGHDLFELISLWVQCQKLLEERCSRARRQVVQVQAKQPVGIVIQRYHKWESVIIWQFLLELWVIPEEVETAKLGTS